MTDSEESSHGGPPYDPTTLRFPGVDSGEQPDHLAEYDPGLTDTDHATIDALRPGTALLVVLRGPNTGARFLLDAPETSSGRSPDSDIFLDDVTVSRRHAVFQRVPGGFTVRDVGSLNGTYVNRQRIEQVELATGDEVQVGKFRLVYYGANASDHGS